MTTDLLRQWLGVETLREAAIDMAASVAPVGVELLVVKGLYYAFALGADPARRSMLDADAVVVRGSFDAAVVVLQARPAWILECDDWSTKGYRHLRTTGFVDLHRLPLPLYFGSVDPEGLRARARTMPAVFGPHILVPDPYDAASISLANYVKDCLDQGAAARIAGDLSLAAARGGVAPSSLAERLQQHGLRRIGIVAFTGLASTDPRWGPWLEALGPSAVERRAAAFLVNAMKRHATNHPDLSFLAARSIADTPLRAAAGFAVTSARFGRDRIRPLLGDRRGRWLRGAL